MFTPRAFARPSVANADSAEPRVRLDVLSRFAIIFCVGLTALLLAVAPNPLRYAFTGICLITGVVLYTRNKPAFVSFVLWVWILSAWLHRVVDYRSLHSVEPSPILTAPPAVTMLCAWSLITRARDLARSAAIPFVCAFAGLAYGTFIGLLNPQIGILFVGKALALWLPAIFFGFFIYAHRDEFPLIRRAFEQTILIALFLCSLYGLYQFFVLPPWDSGWIKNVGEEGVFGFARPMQVRIFGTISSSQGNAAYLMTSILIVIGLQKGWLRIPAIIFGIFCMPLTSVRTSWFGLAVGVIYLLLANTRKERMRVAVFVLGGVLTIGGLLALPQAGEFVTKRFDTLFHLKEDGSAQERMLGTKRALHEAFNKPTGDGMGAMDTIHQLNIVKFKHARYHGDLGPHDNSIVELLFSLGYIGSLLYVFGLAFAVYNCFHGHNVHDPFTVSMISVLISLLSLTFLDSIMIGWWGIILWLTTSMAITMQLNLRAQHVAQQRTRPLPFWLRTRGSASSAAASGSAQS